MPSTLLNDPKRIQDPANEEQPIHQINGYVFVADREEGLVVVNVEALFDGNPENNFLYRVKLSSDEGKDYKAIGLFSRNGGEDNFNPDGRLTGASHVVLRRASPLHDHRSRPRRGRCRQGRTARASSASLPAVSPQSESRAGPIPLRLRDGRRRTQGRRHLESDPPALHGRLGAAAAREEALRRPHLRLRGQRPRRPRHHRRRESRAPAPGADVHGGWPAQRYPRRRNRLRRTPPCTRSWPMATTACASCS